jgi:thiol-disulfide isomerase/thioredoxin
MRTLFTVLALGLSIIASAQTPRITRDASGGKIITGLMNREELSQDTAFAWFAQNQQGFKPNASAIQSLKSNKDSIHVIAFGGTWCGDTRYILPKFYSLADSAGLTPSQITLIGVDQSKKTVHNLTEAFGVTRVPTLILMRNGKEVGRVVEYGRTGQWDRELGELLNK